MSSKKFFQTILKVSGGVLLLLCIVLGIRTYCLESFRISTNAMEKSILYGDFVLVNKLDQKGNPGRNRAVLFTSPLRRDSLQSPLLVSRIVGMPGDTITVENNCYLVNGKQIPKSPLTLATYFITNDISNIFRSITTKLSIPLREWKSEAFGFTCSLTAFEEYQIREELPGNANDHFVQKETEEYKVIVPKKGQAYQLNEASLKACREMIMKESGGKAVFNNGKLFLNGKETNYYLFKQDYYWVLSDNINHSVDSRHLGLIPASHIIGNVWFCWKSNDPERILKTID